MRRKTKRRTPPAGLAGLLAALLVPAAAAGVVLARRRSARGAQPELDVRGPAASEPGPVSQEPVTERVDQEWSCECGQRYRIAGEGLHRIYWLPDASLADPVMDGRCANCGRPLPGEQPDPVQAT